MESIINKIKKEAKENKKTIILPESMDRRILEATEEILKQDLAKIILIGKEETILNEAKDLDLTGAKIINPKKSNLTQNLIDNLYELRKEKGLTKEEAKELLLEDYMYFACMLVKLGYADGIVSGACHSTSNTLRPALQILKTKKDINLVSSFFLMEVPNCNYGLNGTFIFSDAGLIQNPTPEQLAEIAKNSADSFSLLTKEKPIVALLSHSTKGSASHPDVDKVILATKIAKEKYKEYTIDGELQLDSAIDKDVAKTKCRDSQVAGNANVLIFPDLDAGNIGYKLVQRLAKANAYGPITQGISKPVNDLSRGCTKEDIIGVVAITAIQANNNE